MTNQEEIFDPSKVVRLLITGGFQLYARKGSYREFQVPVAINTQWQETRNEYKMVEFFELIDSESPKTNKPKVIGKTESIIAMWLDTTEESP